MKPADPSADPRDAAGRAPTPTRVLVVDDDPGIRRMIRRVLERNGCEVAEVSDGRRALEHYRAHPPDVAFVDLILPGLDGAAVMREIRAEYPAAHLVAMSGATHLGGLEVSSTARRAGADEFLAKPLWPHTILAAVHARRPPIEAGSLPDAAEEA